MSPSCPGPPISASPRYCFYPDAAGSIAVLLQLRDTIPRSPARRAGISAEKSEGARITQAGLPPPSPPRPTIPRRPRGRTARSAGPRGAGRAGAGRLVQRGEELLLAAEPSSDDDGVGGEGHDQVRHAGRTRRDGLLPDRRRARLALGCRGLELAARRARRGPASRARRATPLPEPNSSSVDGAPSCQARQSMTAWPTSASERGAAQDPPAVDDAGADAGRNGQIGDGSAPPTGAEQGLSDGGQVRVVGDVHLQPELGGQSLAREEFGPPLGEVGGPEQPPRFVVDAAGESHHGVRCLPVAPLGGDGSDQVGQRRRHVGLARRGDGSPQQHLTALVHQGSAHLGPTDVGGQDRWRHLTGLRPTPVRDRIRPCAEGGGGWSAAPRRCPCGAGGRRTRSRRRG